MVGVFKGDDGLGGDAVQAEVPFSTDKLPSTMSLALG